MAFKRPLSPHLQVYKPQLTSLLSISHRFTGIILSFAGVITALWFWSLAYEPDLAAGMLAVLQDFYGRIALSGVAFCFYYHLANGIRHLFWDLGWGFELSTVYLSGYLAVGGAALAAVATLYILLGGM